MSPSSNTLPKSQPQLQQQGQEPIDFSKCKFKSRLDDSKASYDCPGVGQVLGPWIITSKQDTGDLQKQQQEPTLPSSGKEKSLTTLQQPKPDKKSVGPSQIDDNSNIPNPKTLTTPDKSADKQKKQDLDGGDKDKEPSTITKPDGTTETTTTKKDGARGDQNYIS